MTDGGNRETGLGFYQQRRGQTGRFRSPSGRAACSVANHPAGPCSPWRPVSDTPVQPLPLKRLIDQMNRFVPPSGIEPASTVLQTVALPFKLQRRMPSRRGDVATRLPIRRHLHHLFASCHGLRFPRLSLLG